LLKALSEEGLNKEQGYRMVKLLIQERNVFLRTFQEKVFGLGSAEINRPLQAAVVMGLSFVLGALIPIVPYTITAGLSALYLSALLGGLTLFGVGAFKGYLAGKSLMLSGLQFSLVAVGAAGSGYLIGLIVQYFFPGVTVPAG
jgi:vacuolar iron transporter family protein